MNEKYVYIVTVAQEYEGFSYGDTILSVFSDANKAHEKADKYIDEHGGVYKVIRMELE